MPTVQVDLQEGFSGERVVVHVGEQRLERQAVTTRAMLGLADTLRAEQPPGRTAVHVEVPDREISDTFEVDVSDDVYLGVSLSGDALVPIVSAQPFGYA